MSAVIGILGGMGPRATVAFEQLLLDQFSGTDQALPTIITINDGSIPDRTEFLLGRGADPAPQLLANALKLERLGADVIVMPCNTAHAPAIFNRLASLETPILHMPKLTVEELGLQRVKRVLLLATTGTLTSGFFQALISESGVECVTLSGANQELLSDAITAVKAGETKMTTKLANKLKTVIEATGISAVILGCTELPLIQKELLPESAQPFDTLAILARATATYTKSKAATLKETIYDTRPIYA